MIYETSFRSLQKLLNFLKTVIYRFIQEIFKCAALQIKNRFQW